MFNPVFLNISGDIQSKVIEYMSLKRSGSEVHRVFTLHNQPRRKSLDLFF